MRLRASSVLVCAGALWMSAGPASAQDAVSGGQGVKAPSRVRLLRAYDDVVKVDGREEARRIELYFDYTDGVAREVVYDGDGSRIAERIVGGHPRPTPEEIAEAISIVRADRILGGMLARVKAVPDGGFILEEEAGRACGPRTRCLHVFWFSPDRVGLVRWTVVDLVRQSIAYRHYAPPENVAGSEGVSR